MDKLDNKFKVHAKGKKVALTARAELSPAEALHLAAWLVAVAQPLDGGEFLPLLDAAKAAARPERRVLSDAERAVFDDCPACGAKAGERCSGPRTTFPNRRTGIAHVERMRSVPYSVPAT